MSFASRVEQGGRLARQAHVASQLVVHLYASVRMDHHRPRRRGIEQRAHGTRNAENRLAARSRRAARIASAAAIATHSDAIAMIAAAASEPIGDPLLPERVMKASIRLALLARKVGKATITVTSKLQFEAKTLVTPLLVESGAAIVKRAD